jgi:hypothetical protein
MLLASLHSEIDSISSHLEKLIKRNQRMQQQQIAASSVNAMENDSSRELQDLDNIQKIQEAVLDSLAWNGK